MAVATLLLMTGCATATSAEPPVEQESVPGRISYSGTDGTSCDQAVVIKGAVDRTATIKAEIDWLADRHPGSIMIDESVVECADGPADRISVEIPGGEKLEFFFKKSQLQER